MYPVKLQIDYIYVSGRLWLGKRSPGRVNGYQVESCLFSLRFLKTAAI
jgi:hypothetical protein